MKRSEASVGRVGVQVLAGITPCLLEEGSVRRAIHDEDQPLGGHPVQQSRTRRMATKAMWRSAPRILR